MIPEYPSLSSELLLKIYSYLTDEEGDIFFQYLQSVEVYMHYKNDKIDTDNLTGVYNRKKFDFDLSILTTMAQRTKKDLSLLMLDLDNFKNINTVYGHQIGDEVLKNSIREVRNTLREYDLCIYRYGGEEFAIIIPEISLESAVNIGNRIVKNIYENVYLPSKEHVTMSIGVANYMPNCTSLEELIKFADRGLYQAKDNGKNRVEVYVP